MFENPATVCNRQVENKNYFIKVGKGVIRKDMMNKNPHQLSLTGVSNKINKADIWQEKC